VKKRTNGPIDIEELLAEEHARATPQRLPAIAAVTRNFSILAEDRYQLAVPELGTVLEVDRLRRDHGELIGELSVSCDCRVRTPTTVPSRLPTSTCQAQELAVNAQSSSRSAATRNGSIGPD
jgi:hypothetical protein